MFKNVVGKGYKVVQSTQDDAVKSTSDAELKQQVALLNLARDGDSLIIGSGMRHPFPEMVEAIQLAEAERKKDEEKRHNSTMAALQQRLNDLQAQVAHWKQVGDDLENQLGGLDAIAEFAGVEINAGDNDEDVRREANENILAMVAAGQVPADSDYAVMARARAKQYQAQNAISDLEQTRITAEVTGDYTALDQKLEETELDTLGFFEVREDSDLNQSMNAEVNDRRSVSEAEHDVDLSKEEQIDTLNDFFAIDDSFAESAHALNIAGNFQKAAEGTIPVKNENDYIAYQAPSMIPSGMIGA